MEAEGTYAPRRRGGEAACRVAHNLQDARITQDYRQS
jgi:hypothetical protein